MPDAFRLDDSTIAALRGPKASVDARRANAVFVEHERSREGTLDEVLVVLLANRECPFRCVFCDLWRDTLDVAGEPGDVAHQVERALAAHPGPRRIKLYNAGSFFDERAISAIDRDAIAALVSRHDEVIVECHPSFLDDRAFDFAQRIGGRLEVAIGLETADPVVARALNKKMMPEDFRAASLRLRDRRIAVRTFILQGSPGVPRTRHVEDALASLTFARAAGSDVATVIPVRGGNGAMERLAEDGAFEPPSLEGLEEILSSGIEAGGGRVFADLWSARSFVRDDDDRRRLARLEAMNREQTVVRDDHT